MCMALSGCDPWRSQLAEWIAPQSAQEALQSVNGLLDAGQYRQALEKAASRTDKQDAPFSGDFAFAAARACAYLGDAECALRYLGLAVSSLDLSPDVAMSEPAFETLRTDVRFLQIITTSSAQRPNTTPPSRVADKRPDIEVNADGVAQIKMDAQTIEVRAGNATARIGN